MTVTADRLRKRMADTGVRQEDLAEAVGCTQGAISKILKGDTLNSKFLPRIALHLGVALEWLLGTSDEMQPAGAGILLSPDERDLIESWRQLGEDARAAALALVRAAGGTPPAPRTAAPDERPTLHDERKGFRGEHD
jgi:transcriptional regulator with XRE-family HTH domain